MTQLLSQLSDSITMLVANASPRLTAIRIGPDRHLTGFIWRDNLVITSDQALPAAAGFSVVLSNGALTSARPGPRDAINDLAAVWLDRPLAAPPLSPALSTSIGSLVLALGADFDGSPTVRLTAIHAFPRAPSGPDRASIRLDLTGASAERGSLVLDADGRLLGMVSLLRDGAAVVVPHGVIARFAESNGAGAADGFNGQTLAGAGAWMPDPQRSGDPRPAAHRAGAPGIASPDGVLSSASPSIARTVNAGSPQAEPALSPPPRLEPENSGEAAAPGSIDPRTDGTAYIGPADSASIASRPFDPPPAQNPRMLAVPVADAPIGGGVTGGGPGQPVTPAAHAMPNGTGQIGATPNDAVRNGVPRNGAALNGMTPHAPSQFPSDQIPPAQIAPTQNPPAQTISDRSDGARPDNAVTSAGRNSNANGAHDANGTPTIHGGRRGWLGVSLQPITVPDVLVARAGQPTARQVVGITRGGPADRAGLRTGDVLLAVDGTTTTGPHTLRAFLASERIGSQVEVRLMREGVIHTAKLTVAAQPDG